MGMEQTPLVDNKQAEGWGSIDKIVNAPLINVPPDASWISVILMWLTLPISLVQGIVGGLIKSVMVCMSVGTCCIPFSYKLCSAAGSVMLGRPIWLAWTWWRYVISGLVALMANGKSRLALFIWEWEAFGKGDYWWHGEGIWCWSYEDCDTLLKSEQARSSAFGCVRACIPDLYATNILIFLSNFSRPDCEWSVIRKALHEHFLDTGLQQYKKRQQKMPELLAADWQQPKIADLNNTALLQKSVCKCVFYMMFGKWITEEDATLLQGWRTNALFFILPRLVQRFMFNYGINKVKQLRIDTVGLVQKYELEDAFVNMNNNLTDQWKRSPVVKLCDEIMYVIGFAGIGGTCAAVESMSSFLQAKIPAESAANAINFGTYDTPEKMVEQYKKDPETYIRETCRLDPPVTSATCALKTYKKVQLAGREFEFPAGLLNQYTLSMANRDPTVFPEPNLFNPNRPNLNKALTWNGAFGATDEASYPRICPGRWLSMDIVTTIINHCLEHGTQNIGMPKGKEGAPPSCC